MSATMLKSAARFIDQSLTKLQIQCLGEKQALIVFLFHTIFQDEAEEASDIVHPGLGIQLSEFERFVEYFSTNGYRFVSPDDVLNGLPSGKHCLITFDDGYFNNLRVLPVLEKYDAPCLFFISTNHVKENRAYWWDVLYRELSKQGKTADQIDREINVYQLQRHDEIEADIVQKFGPESLVPVSDLDRPLTSNELQDFAAHELVHLGNHTCDHALLTNYDDEGVRFQIESCQRDLEQLTGKTPTVVSYPNGDHSDRISQISKEVGLQMGITTVPKKNLLPLDKAGWNEMQLGRFMPDRNDPIIEQCFNIRSDVRFLRRLKSIGKRPGKAGY